ncbi:MAG: serine hydrolase [Bacteroidota bacterium]
MTARSPFFLISFLLIGLLTAQSKTEQFRAAALAALAAYDTPGFSVGIIKDGEVILSEGFGTRTIHQNEPVDGNTLFAIASNTKAFIGTAIAQLASEGKLQLDAPVRDYLPYFALYDDYVSAHTTVRDLLCHRVGLGTFSGDLIWYKSEKTAEEIIRQIKYLPPAYGWRGGYGYTNLMFITAGEVIKAVSGKSWDVYIREKFLAPLGMNRTQTSVLPLKEMDNIATPHVTHRKNLPISMAPWEASGAAGGIISSTNDMLKWINAQLNNGTIDKKVIFDEKVQNQTMRVYNSYAGKLDFGGIGLGWFIYEIDGKTVVNHGGGYDGMYSRVLMIPEEKLGIVVLTNSMTGLSSTLASYIRDVYLKRDTEGWLEKAKEAEASGRKRWQKKFVPAQAAKVLNTRPTLQLDAMVGTYHDPLFGDIIVSESEDGTLELSFAGSPSLTAGLRHWHYDTYELDWHEEHAWFDFGTVQFLSDNNQRVTELQFSVPNDDIFFEEIHPIKQ